MVTIRAPEMSNSKASTKSKYYSQNIEGQYLDGWNINQTVRMHQFPIHDKENEIHYIIHVRQNKQKKNI